MYPKRMHSSRMLTWTETPLWTETPSGQRPLDRDAPLTETTPDRDPPGHVTCVACQDSDPPLDRQTPVKTLPWPKLRLRAVKRPNIVHKIELTFLLAINSVNLSLKKINNSMTSQMDALEPPCRIVNLMRSNGICQDIGKKLAS